MGRFLLQSGWQTGCQILRIFLYALEFLPNNLEDFLSSCPLLDKNYCVVCVCAQENHMRSVMMSVLEGGGAAEGEEQMVERSAEQAKLGVNLLLFAGSR